jgi:hypothetical protein
MDKLTEFFYHTPIKSDWKTQYIRYRLGRLKHQYWLWNRKNINQKLIDQYDWRIIQNCQPGKTVFFGSAGYYLKDIYPEITVVEMHTIVKSFYPEALICTDRNQLTQLNLLVDNFAVVNNRADHWVDINGLSEHLLQYTKIMNVGCRVFYSFRDTQIHVNRLTTDLEKHFLHWAQSLEATHDLKLVWHDVNFLKKQPDANGYYDMLENPDTANGNLKFWFVFKGKPWNIIV